MTGHRSQVTGHRSQVIGQRSEVKVMKLVTVGTVVMLLTTLTVLTVEGMKWQHLVIILVPIMKVVTTAKNTFWREVLNMMSRCKT